VITIDKRVDRAGIVKVSNTAYHYCFQVNTSSSSSRVISITNAMHI